MRWVGSPVASVNPIWTAEIWFQQKVYLLHITMQPFPNKRISGRSESWFAHLQNGLYAGSLVQWFNQIMSPNWLSGTTRGKRPISSFNPNVCFGTSLSWKTHQEILLLKIRHSKAGRFIGIFFFLWPRWVFGNACFYRFLIKIILGWHYSVQLWGYSSIWRKCS